MAYSDEFRELITDAQEAVFKLLRASRQDSWMRLRAGYGEMRDALDAEQRLDELERITREGEERRAEWDRKATENKARWKQEEQQHREARNGWKGLDRNVKKGRILTALGKDGLIRSEIVKRIKEAHPGIDVYENDLALLLSEMLAAGDLERVKEPRGPNHTITAHGGYRWRWRRCRGEMSPELQDLERRLKAGA